MIISRENAGGLLMLGAALAACIIANSPLAGNYQSFLDMRLGIEFSDFASTKTMTHWINDGLMAIFFFLVGLEIKREILKGELSSPRHALLPFIAAIGGMAVPALIYYLINAGNDNFLKGWALPSATDIAFALAVLSLLGDRVPASLKILLMAIAVIDDLGAILIIGFFYTDDLSLAALGIASCTVLGLFALNRFDVMRRGPYILAGLVLWAAVLKSGVHATLAGVITALFIPLAEAKDDRTLEEALRPWVAFFILPLFAFANAGLSLEDFSLKKLGSPLTLGIILGLFVGKQLGIFSALWLSIKTGLCRPPSGVGWMQLWGISILCGIGFTMSLFIGTLAFEGVNDANAVRLGVLIGSILSAAFGFMILYYAKGKDHAPLG